ncbi:hypothetical protein BS78_02G321700 [Paspalum vaginatum]|nr:hypothetical protein BS78_02G321700 [Paspalum vaginatum]
MSDYWSSLPTDLVSNVGKHLLVDDDIDCYMHLRAVCKSWRDTGITNNPMEQNYADPSRFQPSKWVLLDRHGDVLTFVNVETGRFLVKNIPLLRKYFFVGATGGGLIILEEPTSPYQACVLNPFTGSIARFKVSVPTGGVKAFVVTSSPMMLFVSGNAGSIMWADQNSEDFHEYWADYRNTPLSMAPFLSDVYLSDQEGSILSPNIADASAEERSHLSAQTISMATKIRSHDRHPAWDYYLVESGRELLLVARPWYNKHSKPVVHRVNIEKNKLELVRSIGNRALFVSDVRCLSVDANKFQAIEGGCIYFIDPILAAGNREASLITTFHVADRVQDAILDLDNMAGCSQQPFSLAQVFADYCRSIYYSERGRRT